MLRIVLLLIFNFLSVTASSQQISKKVEYKDIALLDGSILVKEAIQDKVIVVNLWGTWCKPCIQELPELNELVEKYTNEEVLFLAVVNQKKDTPEKIYKLLEKRDFNFKHMAPMTQCIFMDLAGGAKYPTTIIYSKTGAFIKKYVGSLSAQELKNLSRKIDDLLIE